MQKIMTRCSAALAGAFAALALTGAAQAAQPVDKGLGLQPMVTPVGRDIHFFHDVILLPIITIISLFVLGLLVWVVIRYNAKANPVPAKFTHHVGLEVAWTGIPILILIGISVVSFPLLYKEDQTPEKFDMTVKVTGHQWYWSYEYPDHDDYGFAANMLSDADAAAQNKPRLLGTDNPMVVPVNSVVRLQVTASDVIHSWAMPAFGVKMDAIPGRLNEAWFKAETEGTYYGQCSEICGIRHAFMPIEVKVVSQAEYDRWIASNTTASVPASTQLAAAPAAAAAN
jgi:cytochrome c oxidase subunit II